MGTKRAFLQIEEGLVHYRESSAAPAEDSTAILLLHASPSSSLSLQPLLEALGPSYRVLAPDTLGNGDSSAPLQPAPSVADYADATRRFCDQLGLQKVHVYGSHTGAHIGAEFAAMFPERVEHLILDGLAVLDDETRAEFLREYAPPQIPREDGAQFDWAWQYIRDQMIFFPHYKKDAEHRRTGGTFDPQVLHQLTMDVLNALETYHLSYNAVFRHDLEACLARVRCPTLWLDTGDKHLAEGAELVTRLVSESTVSTTHNSPQDFARAITSFTTQRR